MSGSTFNERNRVIEVIRRGQRGLDGDVGLVTTVERSSTFTAVAGERGYAYRCTAALTANFEQASTLTNGWHCIIDAVGGDVTLDPNGAETINGLATLVVPQNGSALVYSDGTALFARFFFGSAYTALNGLPTAADKALYSTGVGVWAEMDINAQGRDILANATSTAAEVNLLDGKSLSGADAELITGTSGADTELGQFNGDGDLVGGPKYAVGTFSPTLTLGSGTVDTYLTQTGNYTRIGKRVFFEAYVRVNTATSPSGFVRLSGLPFGFAAANVTYVPASLAGSFSGPQIAGVMETSDGDLFYYDPTTNERTAMNGTELTVGGDLMIFGSYETDDA